MVNIVMLCAGPEGEEMMQAPWEFVATVCINRLEESAHDPDVHGQDVEVSSDRTPQNRRANGSQT